MRNLSFFDTARSLCQAEAATVLDNGALALLRILNSMIENLMVLWFLLVVNTLALGAGVF